MIPIVTGAGIAIDYTAATNARARLDAIVDAAALAAVGPQVMNSGMEAEKQKEAGIKRAESELNALLSLDAALAGIVKSKSVSGSTGSGTVAIKVCYEAETKTTLMQFIQVKTIPFGRCVSSSATAPEFVDVYILVDASSSMGIGATTADQTLMQNRLGCAFVCHAANWETPTNAPNCDTGNGSSHTPTCAKKIGARIRFDVVKASIGTLIDRAKANSTMPSQFRFSISKFSNDLTLVQPISSDLDRVKSAANSMTMDVSGGTNIKYSFAKFSSSLPKSGDGKSASSPKTIVVLMTDAIENQIYMYCSTIQTSNGIECSNWARELTDVNFTVINSYNFLDKGKYSVQLTDSQYCNSIKLKSAILITLNIEYIIPPKMYDKDGNDITDIRFALIQNSIGLDNIKKSMSQCASSPDLAYYASTPGDIELAMAKIYKSLGKSASLRE